MAFCPEKCDNRRPEGSSLEEAPVGSVMQLSPVMVTICPILLMLWLPRVYLYASILSECMDLNVKNLFDKSKPEIA